ncbi:MAG: hypothetical protein EAZ73_07335 [Oscillatoriales cyanobacterium]|nr:MAG: hypothetical protein EAZ73_07335 [Oscillatoriales cyanobacterium]
MKIRCFVLTLAALLGKALSDFWYWVEGVLTDNFGSPCKSPHSLGKIIEWKLDPKKSIGI